MVVGSLDGRISIASDIGSAAYGTLGVGTRLGGAGWISLRGGGGWLGGDLTPAAIAEVALAPRGFPVALHGSVTGFWAGDSDRPLGVSLIESEVRLRWPGNRTFWGDGRRGSGFTLGARTADGAGNLTIQLGVELTGFD